ncbi:hypothetical protein AAHH80_40920, partial [Burkholderia pseudomallei]
TCPSDPFDANPWLLATPAGGVGLRVGSSRGARPEDMRTRVTGCAPDFGGDCPSRLAILGACIHGFHEYGEPRSSPPG